MGLFIYFIALPHPVPCGCVGMCVGRGLVKSSRVGFQPAIEFTGSEDGASWQPSIPFHTLKKLWPLGAAEKAWRFLSATPTTVVYFTGSQRSGPGETFHPSNDITHLGSLLAVVRVQGERREAGEGMHRPFLEKAQPSINQKLPPLGSLSVGASIRRLRCRRPSLKLARMSDQVDLSLRHTLVSRELRRQVERASRLGNGGWSETSSEGVVS